MTLRRSSKTTQHPCKRSKINSRIAALMAGGKVPVDIGCGAGYGLDEISKFYEIAVGIDVNTTRLKQRATPPYRWHFVLANLNEQFPLKNDYVDLVFANQVIEHIADPRFLLSEIFRILKQRGVVIITTPNIRYVKNLWRIVVKGQGPRTAGGNQIDGPWDGGHLHYFTHRDIREIFSEAGFSNVSSTGLVNLENGGLARRLADRYSVAGPVREFLSGNILLIARE